MKNKCKKVVLIVILLCVVTGLVFIGSMVALNKYRVAILNNPETHVNRIVEIVVNIGQDIDGQVFFGTEELAKEYVRVLFTEHVEGFEEWVSAGDGYGILLVHYPEYGVWYASLATPNIFIGRMPQVVFQESDGKILSYRD